MLLCCRRFFCVDTRNFTTHAVLGGTNDVGVVLGERLMMMRRMMMMLKVPALSTWHPVRGRSSAASFSSSSSNDRGDDARDDDDSEKKKKKEKKKTIRVVFVEKTGEEIAVDATVGESVMEAAHQNDVELEGMQQKCRLASSLLLTSKRRRRLMRARKNNNTAHITLTFVFFVLSRNDDTNNNTCNTGACEGSLACSTCHVVVEDPEVFDKLPEACDDENDMLDLAFGLTETSRLGCQIIAKEDIDGIRVKIPAATRNFAVDGFVPKPH